jgi:hypothetical protein
LPITLIFFPLKPIRGYTDFFKSFSVKPIWTKHYQVRTSAELPVSTRILPTSFPKKCTKFLPMFALMSRGLL